MNAKEWAARLNGREYLEEMTADEIIQSRLDGVLIVFGGSDDLIEFRGVICDEQGALLGGTFKLTPKLEAIRIGKNTTGRLFTTEEVFKQLASYPEVQSVWCPSEGTGIGKWASWEIRTGIPHETFDIMEDGEIFCRGVVIAWGNVFPKVSLKQDQKPNTAPDALESGMCCELCIKQETPNCPVKTASPWSRWGNYCNEFERAKSI